MSSEAGLDKLHELKNVIEGHADSFGAVLKVFGKGELQGLLKQVEKQIPPAQLEALRSFQKAMEGPPAQREAFLQQTYEKLRGPDAPSWDAFKSAIGGDSGQGKSNYPDCTKVEGNAPRYYTQRQDGAWVRNGVPNGREQGQEVPTVGDISWCAAKRKREAETVKR